MGVNVNRVITDPQVNLVQQQMNHRIRDSSSNEPLRMPRDMNFGQTEINRFQTFQQQQPQLPPQPQIQPLNPILQNPQLLALLQQQQQQQQQVSFQENPLQNNAQNLQQLLQQQQQMQLIQNLITQSAQISQQPTVMNQQQQVRGPTQPIDFQKLLKNPTIPPQQQQPQQQNLQQQQMLFQSLLQLQQLQQQPSQSVFNSQQFKQTPLISEVNSQLTTPLETTRIINAAQIPNTVNNQQIPQQHQYFVQNYNQLQENLSQYRKLVNYLEQIEEKKQIQQQQLQQQAIIQEKQNDYQQKVVQRKDNSRNDIEIAPVENNSKASFQNEPLRKTSFTSSINWPSQFSSDIATEKKFTSPQNCGQPLMTFKSSVNEPQYTEIHQKSIQEPQLYKEKSIQENQLLGESKFIDGDFDNENVEDSKSSGELTKESFTEGAPNIQIPMNVISMQSDTNKSQGTLIVDCDEVMNGSHISEQNKSLSGRKARGSQNHSSLIQEEQPVNVEEKPIINHQLTFEELLETKLQQQEEESYRTTNITNKPKRDFLRKSSTNRAHTSSERTKSQTKYRYYADNFDNQAQLSQQQHQHHSPQSVNTSTTQRRSEQSNQKQSQFAKSNQKQPKQQRTLNNRPHSQQQQQQSSSNKKSRSRQINNAVVSGNSSNGQNSHTQSVNQSKMLNIQSAEVNKGLSHEEDQLLSDRNSVAEFEMLEKECIAKFDKQSVNTESQQQDQNTVVDSSINPNNTSVHEPKISSGSKQPKLSKAAMDFNQKQIDNKVKELEQEILKFQQENKKVQQLQRECEQQLKRVTNELEEFESRKEQELIELQEWKREQRLEIQREREELEKEREEVNERLLERIRELERDKLELEKKIDELTDKELHCKGVQTIPLSFQDTEINTVISGEIQPMKQLVTQSLSPVKFIQENNYKNFVEPQFEQEQRIRQLETENDIQDGEDIVEQEEQKQEVQENYSLNEVQQEAITQEEQLDQEQDSLENEDSDEDEFDLKFPPEYHKNPKQLKLVEEIIGHDGKIQRFFDNGKKEVVFTNGVKREIWPDGYSVVYFNNNDIKQTFPDQKIVYYFSDARTTQTTFPNGLQVFKFSNNQIEKHFADGTKEISFPDGTIKCIFPDGEEESIFPDGTIQKIEKTGVRIIEFPSGQRDILYPDGTKVREFEDGSIKKINPDGRVEIIQAKPVVQQKKNNQNVIQSNNKNVTRRK